MYELTLPKNSDKVEKLTSFLAQIDKSKKPEEFLTNQLRQIKGQKFEALKEMKYLFIEITLRK